MKVCSWNLGLFSWMKYARKLGFKINDTAITNEYYARANLGKIQEVLSGVSSDVLIVQELFNEKDVWGLKEGLAYKNYHLVDTWYHEHSIGVLANEKISVIHKEGEFVVLEINGLKIIPVHLHSFSPDKRLKQVRNLLGVCKKAKPDVIMGDTNLWRVKGRPVWRAGKTAYELLTKQFRDASAGLPTSYFKIAMDKAFVRYGIKSNVSVVRERGEYMDHYPIVIDV